MKITSINNLGAAVKRCICLHRKTGVRAKRMTLKESTCLIAVAPNLTGIKHAEEI